MHHKSSMKTVKALSMLGSAVILALLCGTPALAATLRVDDDQMECPDAGFKQIQNAVNQGAPSDIIEVCPGIYDEQIKITKPLTLVGVGREGKKAAVIQPSNMTANSDFFGDPIAPAILVKGTSDVTIRNITVDGSNNGLVCEPTTPFLSGIFFRNSSGEIESVAVRNMLSPDGCALGDAIDVQGSEQAISRLTVRDSSIHDYDAFGIFAFGPGTNLQARRNAVTGPVPTPGRGPVGIFLAGAEGGLIEDNTVVNNIDATCISLDECDFVGIGIIVFRTNNVDVLRNVVGKSQRAISASLTSGVRILENRVFDTDVVDAINVFGADNTVIKDNIITNSDRAAVKIFTGNNTIQDNTINEAGIGLLVAAGNNVSGNRLFNTAVTRELFVPGAAAHSSQDSLRRAVIPTSVLRSGSSR